MGGQSTRRGRGEVIGTALALVLTLQVAPAWSQTQPDGATEVADRAARYTAEFVSRFSGVVTEETYEQRVPAERQTRRLISVFLLVPQGASEFLAFRDVFEVDGTPVRDRDERLMKLFVARTGDTLRRASEITNAGSRYNLEGIGSLNNPLLALAFLQDAYRRRFRTTLGRRDRDVGPEVWVVSYTEFVRPALILGNGNRELPSRVLAWVDWPTGRVLKTELSLGDPFARGTGFSSRIETTFSDDERFGINVPGQLREWHSVGRYDVTGVAKYGRFRRFTVTTDESVR